MSTRTYLKGTPLDVPSLESLRRSFHDKIDILWIEMDYWSYQFATEAKEKNLTDRQAYDFWKSTIFQSQFRKKVQGFAIASCPSVSTRGESESGMHVKH